MMYKFKSRATGDVLMTQPVGERVLAIIGKPPAPQGIVDVDQLPAAIAALEAAAAAEPRRGPQDDDEPRGGDRGDAVSLRQRVWPMVEMMKRSLEERQPVVWGV